MGDVGGFVVFTLTAAIQMRVQTTANIVVQQTKRLTRITKAVVLRYGSRVRLIGLHLGDYSFRCRLDYMLDIQLTRQLPFKLIEKTGLT